jgi:hypothetical protein
MTIVQKTITEYGPANTAQEFEDLATALDVKVNAELAAGFNQGTEYGMSAEIDGGGNKYVYFAQCLQKFVMPE